MKNYSTKSYRGKLLNITHFAEFIFYISNFPLIIADIKIYDLIFNQFNLEQYVLFFKMVNLITCFDIF